jgi:hypothetical protein
VALCVLCRLVVYILEIIQKSIRRYYPALCPGFLLVYDNGQYSPIHAKVQFAHIQMSHAHGMRK